MNSGLTPEGQNLHDAAIEWQALAVGALEQNPVQQALGEQRAEQLLTVAKGAGMAIISQAERKIFPSENGLYLVPVTPGSEQRDIYLDIRHEDEHETLSLAELVRDTRQGEPFHLAPIRGGLRLNLIVIPAIVVASITAGDRAALMVHELTHAWQFYRRLNFIAEDESERQAQTRLEAEAYTDQLHIINYYWGGMLTSIMQQSLTSDEVVAWLGKDPELDIALGHSGTARQGLKAVLRNNLHNYVADGVTIPPPELADDYFKRRLIRRDV